MVEPEMAYATLDDVMSVAERFSPPLPRACSTSVARS
jgi:aspartyl/asparaginyl-tRNA synthetase